MVEDESVPSESLEAAVENDVVGTCDEDFEEGMQQNALDRDAADADGDNKLDFGEFCTFVRAREEGEHTDEALQARFAALDEDGSGKVDMNEYLQFSLRDALARSATRVVDLFRAWDEDRSGSVDSKEFYRAIRSLGFDVSQEDSDAVFTSLDEDGSGKLEYAELNAMLRKGEGSSVAKRNLARVAASREDRGRGSKMTAKNVNVNYVSSRVAVLPDTIKLDASSGISVQEQLRAVLIETSVKLIDLFREWDIDGNGALDKKELRQAVAALGYEAPRKDVDALFDSIDDDGTGLIEFEEFKKALKATDTAKAMADKAKAEKAAAAKEAEKQAKEAAAKAQAAKEAAAKAAREAAAAKQVSDVASIAHSRGPMSAPQLRLATFLANNNVTVMEMFREWDEDHNGSLDRQELRRAVALLGYHAEKDDVDTLFDQIDFSGDGMVDFNEMKRALNAWNRGEQPSPRRAPTDSPRTLRPAYSRADQHAAAAEAYANVMQGLRQEEDGGELVVGAQAKHTHTIVMLHPEASSADLFYRLSRRFGPLATECRFVFPRAPVRELDTASGRTAACWFVPYTIVRQPSYISGWYASEPAEDESDREAEAAAKAQLAAQTTRIHALLDREAALLGGDRSRIVLGGSSQGGSVALHAAAAYRFPLCALISLRSMVLEQYTSVCEGKQSATPVYVFAGGRDTLCPLEDCRNAFRPWSAVGYKIEWHVEPDLGHMDESVNEHRYVAYWSARASLGASMAFDRGAVEYLRRSLVIKQPPPSARPFSAQVRASSARSARPHSLPYVHLQPKPPPPMEVHGPAPTPESIMPRVHPLTLEPFWRQPILKPYQGPEWDNRPASALGQPQSRRLERLTYEAKLAPPPYGLSMPNSRPATAQEATSSHQLQQQLLGAHALDAPRRPATARDAPGRSPRNLRHVRAQETGRPVLAQSVVFCTPPSSPGAHAGREVLPGLPEAALRAPLTPYKEERSPYTWSEAPARWPEAPAEGLSVPVMPAC